MANGNYKMGGDLRGKGEEEMARRRGVGREEKKGRGNGEEKGEGREVIV